MGKFPNLVSLNLSKNNITTLKALNIKEPTEDEPEQFKCLQVLNLSENKIGELGPIKVASLRSLNLRENRIEKTENFEGHQKLVSLDLSKNRIPNLKGIREMPALTTLYLSENKIKSLIGMEGLAALQQLHLRANEIKSIGDEESVPNLESLEYLNLRQNNLEKMDEVKKTQGFPKLKVLIVSCTLYFISPLVDWEEQTTLSSKTTTKNTFMNSSTQSPSWSD